MVLFSVILPIFAVIGFGFMCQYRHWFTQSAVADFNRFVYYIAVPPLLYMAMAATPIESLTQARYLVAYLGATVFIWIGLFFLLKPFFKAFEARFLLGLGATFSNSVYLGIPLVQTALGTQATQTVVMIALATNVLFVGGSAVILSARQQSNVRGAAVEVLKNPMIGAIVLGLSASALALPLPMGLERLLELLAQAASPVALFALGLTLGGVNAQTAKVSSADQESWSWSGVLVTVKILIHPLAVWLACLAVGARPGETQVAVLVAALPAGALAHLLAQRFGAQSLTVARGVMLGTALSLLTLSVLLSSAMFAQL